MKQYENHCHIYKNERFTNACRYGKFIEKFVGEKSLLFKPKLNALAQVCDTRIQIQHSIVAHPR